MKDKKKIIYGILGLLGVVALLGIWSFIEPRILDTEEEVANIPNLPQVWQGKQIGLISDFQIGLWGDNRGTVRSSVEELVAAQPAAVLITGDFIYHSIPDPEQEIETAVNLVRPLVEAGIPTYAVLGNHDYGMRKIDSPPKEQLANRLTTALKNAGIQVLDNEAVELQPAQDGRSNQDESEFYLVGIDPYLATGDSVKQALADVPPNSPRIAMMHNPSSFKLFPPQTAPVAVAGHTHGGQVRVPFLPEWSWLMLAREKEVHVDGWSEDFGEPGNKLYVSRGIGMSRAPIRLFCPPELTFFTLEAE